MAYDSNPNRFSTISGSSNVSHQQQQQTLSTQVSTQTLLHALHNAYSAGKPYQLESSTTIVVNTWLSASLGPDGRPAAVVDVELAQRALEHARRRAEDGCIVLAALHESAPSALLPFLSALPLSIPSTLQSALAALQPFLVCNTPENHATGRHSALAASFTLSTVSGDVVAAHLKLSTTGIDTKKGLISIPSKPGYRAFDVFYYLLSSASSSAERDSLGLRSPQSYSLLRKSETYDTPSYLPTADDAAAADEFRASLKAIGISGRERRDLLSVLAALLKLGDIVGYLLDDEAIESACEDAAELLGLDPEALTLKCNAEDRETLIGAIYEALVDWVLSKANAAIAAELSASRHIGHDDDSRAGALTPVGSDDGDTVCITVLDIPDPRLGKAVSLRNVFDDSDGINAEMKQDGVQFPPAGHSVIAEMRSAISEREAELGIPNTRSTRDFEHARDQRENSLEKIANDAEEDSILSKLLHPLPGQGVVLGNFGRFDLPTMLGSSRAWFHLSLHPTDDLPAKIKSNESAWSAGATSSQLRSWRLPEWANRRNKRLDFTADFDVDEFSNRYSRLGCKEAKDGIESFILERGWSNGEVIIGNERIWVREGVWWEAERMLDMLPPLDHAMNQPLQTGSGFFASPFGDNMTYQDSQDNLLQRNQSSATLGGRAKSLAPTTAMTMRTVSGGDYGLGRKGDDTKGTTVAYENELGPEFGDGKKILEQTTSKGRRVWVALVWALTFWIPSPLLKTLGRMKRPDVRMAWREKLVLVFLIFLLNGAVVFYIIEFGRLLCPNYDKAWNDQQVSYHQGTNDAYVSVYGKVYDITKFWRINHNTDGAGNTPSVRSDQMEQTFGQNANQMFPLPLDTWCAPLVSAQSGVRLQYNTTSPLTSTFTHGSGSLSSYPGSQLDNALWFKDAFKPRMTDYYKGDLVYATKDIKNDGQNNAHMWFIIRNQVYDLTDYFYTKNLLTNQAAYSFLDSTLEEMVQNNPGGDITQSFDSWATRNSTAAATNLNCLENVFYIGKPDFRDTAKCQVNNYILLAFTIILCSVILIKFLAALQFGSKRRPAPQDKFVICQVPAYTEGEDHLRKGLDSLTALAYDNKRKLICVICDGMIVGGGNDRPTPKIVLDILGVDPKIDPPALPFKSVGAGSEQLNYGKVYSGLYEFEGNVVPYVVVVKVGKESEQNKSKPGNRGKRDSQIMLMSFLNRVHHRSPMSPLELEMFHQINNIIGVDPELYEYLFMVDADTMVKEDALTRLVAACANDSKIAGICGETSLENEERSWTTMIQVYEYYISHHLAKAFESLFGSVTCLPGCFCMYRLRTADKGKPLIISDAVIDEYSDCLVDTLHKKNLLSLGEDRYLTTLMTKHFPHMKYKFVPDAYAQTAAPETWSILLSQRRRWINSTIHNLAELVWLKDLCGFCCFSMRFVVFIDLFGTIILPATCAYLVYLIVRVATHQGQFPLISIIIIAAVYGLQAIIFIAKRQWQHIGWMIIYILAFPIYSLVLPVYSFWKQDDFSWGNTRIVIGEKGNKQFIATDDEGFDPRSIPLQAWDDYAVANNLPGRRGSGEKGDFGYDDAYEMDDMRSVYSAAKPASTILTGFKSQQQFYMPPQSPAPFAQYPNAQQRHSTISGFSGPYVDQASATQFDVQSRHMSIGNLSDVGFLQQQRNRPYGQQSQIFQSSENLISSGTVSPLNRAGRRSPMPSFGPGSRPASSMNFQQHIAGNDGPTDSMIVESIQACLAAVDLDNVTKKSLKALVEQRLQVQLSAERRSFLDQQIDFELATM